MGEITIRKALDDYKNVYMAYRNFADRTREEYLNDLEVFSVVLEKAGIQNIREVSVPVVERYAARLEQKGFASLTRKRKIVAIRSFLTFLYQDRYISTNIAKLIVLPYTENTTPQVLMKTECDRLRKACADNLRDAAIIELLLQTGIKLSELVHLRLDDIEIDGSVKEQGYLRITGTRGKKERLIPLNSKASTALKSYFEVRRDTNNAVVFLNRFAEPLGERGVQKMLRKYLKKAEIGSASIHTLRHTFGVHHVSKGTDPKIVQEVMGLKDARSTAIYQVLANKVMWREMQENAL